MSQEPLNNMLPSQSRVSNSDILLPTLSAEQPAQMLDTVNCDGIFTNDPTVADPFANYIAFLSSNQPRFRDEGCHEDPDWGTIFDPAQHQYYPSRGLLNFNSPTTASSDMRPTSANAQPTHGSPIRNLRRQNHSCDQCWSSKKACDLPMTVRISRKKPSTSCSTCNNRGLSCTVMWLAGKKSKVYAKKPASMVSHVAEADGNECLKLILGTTDD